LQVVLAAHRVELADVRISLVGVALFNKILRLDGANMDKPITVSFRWSVEEMLLANRLYFRCSKVGRQFRRSCVGGGILCLSLGLIVIARTPGYIFFALLLLFLGAVFLAGPLFLRYAIRKNYAQRTDRDMLRTYEISADRIISRSELDTTEMLWRTITKVYKVREGLFLCPNDTVFHWLPVHGFHDAKDVERLARVAKANVQQYHHAA
jgi:hypothetical protein